MIHVAIMGFGVVGSGVAEILLKNASLIQDRIHEQVNLKYILDIHDFPDSPMSSLIIHDFSIIEADPSVDIVVETIGGIGAAKEYTQRALRAGKSVVTSNKELVATYGYELMTLALENNISYLYEASVGGGIPIIRPLKQCLAANKIFEICGILNGTTNYILTRMNNSKLSLQETLKEAQRNGYAEADPTADVEGYDTCRKICILSALAFGHQVNPENVFTEGITQISAVDVACADSFGYRIKLLGRALRTENDTLQIITAPHLVKKEAPLGGVEDVYNAIAVRGDAIGDVMFYGRGAGKMPTASAVVADIMDVVRNREKPKYLDWEQEEPHKLFPFEKTESRWYVRAKANNDDLLNALGPATILSCDFNRAGEMAALTEHSLTKAELEEKLKDFSLLTSFRILED